MNAHAVQQLVETYGPWSPQFEIERALAERVDGKTRLQLVAEKVVEMALEGDMRAAEFIGKRMWPEKLALEGGKPEVLLILRDYTGRHAAPIDAEVIGP